MTSRQTIDRECSIGWLVRPLLVGVVVSQRVCPEDEGGTIDSTRPPRRANPSRHLSYETQDLTSMCDGFLYVGETLLVHPEHLLVGAIDTFSSCETLDFWEVGDGAHADKMEHDKIGLHHGAHRVGLQIPLRQVEPTPQKRLHLLETHPSRCSSQRPVSRPRRYHAVGEAAEQLAILAYQGLQRVK